MSSPENYRLYSFTANLYLSPLQCGLQTAHVVSNLSVKYDDSRCEDDVYRNWAVQDKTIIILGAMTHGGVVRCFNELDRLARALGLPYAIFYEDEESMNGMATACGVVVPQKYWDTTFTPTDVLVDGATVRPAFYTHVDELGFNTKYELTHPEGQFVNHIKQYRMA